MHLSVSREKTGYEKWELSFLIFVEEYSKFLNQNFWKDFCGLSV